MIVTFIMSASINLNAVIIINSDCDIFYILYLPRSLFRCFRLTNFTID